MRQIVWINFLQIQLSASQSSLLLLRCVEFSFQVLVMKRSTAASPARVTAKYDIVGSLPLELVIQVVKYLNHKDVIRAQRVCSTLIVNFRRCSKVLTT